MTREEHVKFCKICKNQKFDRNKGIVCELTNQIADFVDECSNFEEDVKPEKKGYNNLCWFCETRPRGSETSLPVILAKEGKENTIVIPRCEGCNNYYYRQNFFLLSPIIAGIVALIFGTTWTENITIGAGIGATAFFLLYMLKLKKNRKIVIEQKIKPESVAIFTFQEVKSKLAEGWKYKGIKYRG